MGSNSQRNLPPIRLNRNTPARRRPIWSQLKIFCSDHCCRPWASCKHYFNYGGQGPLPTPSLEAMVACWRELQRLGPFSRDVWPFVGSRNLSSQATLGPALWRAAAPAQPH